jgi:UDP-N-acetylglucosamine--N-acetylmuramyl-(pentapeptide) pyrophosphoryl-undecaprenol N-acetylglucosamine transferase
VSRAGASTVAELAAAGVGSILVPFPAAVDDHQTKNAAWLGQVSAAQVVSESGLTPGELANRLATLFSGGRMKLLAMAEAARSRAVTDAAERVAALCLEAEGTRA